MKRFALYTIALAHLCVACGAEVAPKAPITETAPSALIATSTLYPIANGFYLKLTPTPSSQTNYKNVRGVANDGNLSFNSHNTTGNADCYRIDVSSIPNGGKMDRIQMYGSASRNSAAAGGSTVLGLFYRLDGVNSSIVNLSLPLGTTPAAIPGAGVYFTGVNTYKGSTTALEICGKYVSGDRGLRLGQLNAIVHYVDYSVPPPLPPPNFLGVISMDRVSACAECAISEFVRLEWDLVESNTETYTIFRSDDGLTPSEIGEVLHPVTLYTDYDSGLGFPLGDTDNWHYQIRADNPAGSSALSEVVVVQGITPATNLHTQDSEGDCNLVWDDNSARNQGYFVLQYELFFPLTWDDFDFIFNEPDATSYILSLNEPCSTGPGKYWAIQAYRQDGLLPGEFSGLSNVIFW